MNWGRQLFAAASYLRWCVQKRNGTLRNLIDAASYLRWCIQKRNGTLRNLIVPPVPTVKRMGSLPTWHTTSLGGLVKRSSRNLGDMRVKAQVYELGQAIVCRV